MAQSRAVGDSVNVSGAPRFGTAGAWNNPATEVVTMRPEVLLDLGRSAVVIRVEV
jgi:hypothetical protein